MPRFWSVALIALASSASAQLPPPSDEVRAREAAQMAAYIAKPDTRGTGAFPSIKEEDPGLPAHTIYRPADLGRVGKGQLGIVAWGNGGCSKDGASSRFHLAEIASHGYLVIAPGAILTGPGAKPLPPAVPHAPTPDDYTTVDQVKQGIDWALAQNADAKSPYFGKIDPKKVAVSGFSCGGIQALKLASDPRIKAVIVHNSGLLPDGSPPMAFITTTKALLDTLRTPIIYIQGGPTDIAYQNGKDDFQRIKHVPAYFLNQDTGHGGTFLQDNGGRAATVAVAWLNWQLRGDARAAKMFTGKECGLCRDPAWSIERKNLP